MGLALFANGVLGLALVGIALGALGPLLARASVAADSAGDSLAAAAQALDQTATSFDGFSKSLDDAKTSSAHASQLLNDAATTSSQLADGMAISVFGAQPFLALSQSFRRNTDELRGVSADVSSLSEAIGHNATDVVAVRDSVRVPRDRVQQLATDAMQKSVEQAQPLVKDAITKAQELQRTLVDQTPQVTAAAQKHYNAALDHAGAMIATGKTVLEAGTAQAVGRRATPARLRDLSRGRGSRAGRRR